MVEHLVASKAVWWVAKLVVRKAVHWDFQLVGPMVAQWAAQMDMPTAERKADCWVGAKAAQMVQQLVEN